MTIAEMKAMLGGPARALAPRSTKEMLAAIKSGVMPRWVARVDAKAVFDAGNFGYKSAGQVFATEPADVVGLNAAQALVKVGWTVDQLQGKVGEEIAICTLDTEKAVEPEDGGTGQKPSVGKVDWTALEKAANDPAKNAWFLQKLRDSAGPNGSKITPKDLPRLFQLAAKTPVGAKPNTNDEKLLDQYEAFRMAIANGLSASALYSGMEATVSEKGELGVREVAVSNEGSAFKIQDGVNAVITSLNKLKQSDLDALI